MEIGAGHEQGRSVETPGALSSNPAAPHADSGPAPEDLTAGWLERVCESESARAGLVLLGAPDQGPYRPVAVWPHVQGDLETLAASAERAIRERAALALRPASRGRPRLHIARPIECEGALHGAVVIEVDPGDESDARLRLRRLQLAQGSLEAQLALEARDRARALASRLESALRLVAATADRPRFREAATQVASELAAQLSLDRASFGFERDGRIELVAMSHSARFERKLNLVASLEAAMEEAADQGATLCVPDSGEIVRIVRQHESLAAERGAAICSVVLHAGLRICGVLTAERASARPFTPEERALLESVAAFLGPFLEARRRDERSLLAHARDAGRDALARMIGPEHATAKLVAVIASVLVLVLALVKGDYRVSGRVLLEPLVRRAAVAPFEGYLAEAPRRAGDQVAAGELLARLDDRDLTLERTRAESQVEQLRKQLREARAEDDAARVRILAAGVDEASARLALVNDRLARARVVAPFDGIIVAGDLSQSLGAPMKRGDPLFEIAPLDAFRVVLRVDEHDVRDVAVGQQGQLVLQAAPDRDLPFRVTSVTPVSETSEGTNHFRVEAELAEVPERLRPGMEGVGKIHVDRRRLVWIWTHRAVDWLRLLLWSWLP